MRELGKLGVVMAVLAGGSCAVVCAEANPANLSNVSASTWSQVMGATDDLEFVQRVSGYALTCPQNEYEVRLRENLSLSEERAWLATNVLAESWLARDRASAVRFWKTHRADLPVRVQIRFYAKHAETKAEETVVFLKEVEATEAYPLYLQAAIGGFAKNDPAMAMRLALSQGESASDLVNTALSSIFEKDPAQAMTHAAGIAHGMLRDQAVSHVLSAWFDQSPNEALAWADNASLPEESLHFLGWRFADWSKKNPSAANGILGALKSERLRRALLDASISRAGPAQLWARVANHGWDGISNRALEEMIRHAGERDPEEVTRLFQSIPAERLNDKNRVRELTEAWAWVNPKAAQAWAETLPDDEAREAAILRMNTMWVLIDPKGAFAQIEATPPGVLRAELVRNTASCVAQVDFGQAIAWLNTQPDDAGKRKALESIVEIGATRNPEAAAALLPQLSAGPERTKAYEAFLQKWSSNDPEGAFDWFLLLPAGPERQALSRRAMNELARSVPEYAAAVLGDVADPTEKALLVSSLMGSYVTTHPESLPLLVAEIPAGSVRNQAVVRALGSIAERDPAAAVGYLETMDLGNQRTSAIASLATHWSRHDPAAAAQWIKPYLDDPATSHQVAMGAAGGIAREWARVDPDAAFAWAAQVPSGTARDYATTSLAQTLGKRFPSRAFDAVAAVPSLVKKGTALQTLVKEWNAIDPEAAARHVRASSLPEETKAALLTLNP